MPNLCATITRYHGFWLLSMYLSILAINCSSLLYARIELVPTTDSSKWTYIGDLRTESMRFNCLAVVINNLWNWIIANLLLVFIVHDWKTNSNRSVSAITYSDQMKWDK